MRFNPCFIGNCSHTVARQGRAGKKIKFQSLFYWKLLSYFGIWANSDTLKNVSILVLLETALILSRWPMTWHQPTKCFNPCFIGNCSHTSIRISVFFNRPEFQSLFYWKLLSYLDEPRSRLMAF